MKTVAIVSASSHFGRRLIPILKEKGYTVWTLTRKPLESSADENYTTGWKIPQHTRESARLT